MSQLGLTLTRHILRQQAQHPGATGAFTGILNQIATAAKVVSAEVRKAGLVDILGFTGEQNETGDEVQKLDAYANEVFTEALGYSGYVCVMASEEDSDIVHVPPSANPGGYVVAFDPLDGSSNIDVNVSIGTIFSVWKRVTETGPGTVEDLLQPGNVQVAAGYVIYGAATMLVVTTGNGVNAFTLDPSVGEFLCSHQNLRMPRTGNIYSINEAYEARWDEPFREYVRGLRESGVYRSRYVGSMVADVHRTLLKGGLFMYPGDSRSPQGKLRLMYEGNPMAFIVEQAGGAASTGTGRILDVQPTELHQKTPVFLGSIDQMHALKAALSAG